MLTTMDCIINNQQPCSYHVQNLYKHTSTKKLLRHRLTKNDTELKLQTKVIPKKPLFSVFAEKYETKMQHFQRKTKYVNQCTPKLNRHEYITCIRMTSMNVLYTSESQRSNRPVGEIAPSIAIGISKCHSSNKYYLITINQSIRLLISLTRLLQQTIRSVFAGEQGLHSRACFSIPRNWEYGNVIPRIPGNNEMHGVTPVLLNSAMGNARGTPQFM